MIDVTPPAMLNSNGYREDLAYIHDRGYGDLAADAAGRAIAEMASAGLRIGTVVDLGCGSGVLAEAIVKAGYHVVGIDRSEAMLALARARVPTAEFRQGSFVSAELPASVAITAVGEVVNYVFDPENDDDGRARFFRRVHATLVPGGVFLFDAAGPDRKGAAEPYRADASGPDWAVHVETSLEPDTGLLTRTITSVRKVGCQHRRDEEVHRLVLLNPSAVLESLARAGFAAEILPRYDCHPLPPGVVAFLARKPSE
jgi:SAM-dependent methyltransferase